MVPKQNMSLENDGATLPNLTSGCKWPQWWTLMAWEMTSNWDMMEGIGIWPLLSSLCFKLYSGSFQAVSGDLRGVNMPAAHNAIHDVSRDNARRKENYIFFPRRENLARANRRFFAIDHFPHVIGGNDCTHIFLDSVHLIYGVSFQTQIKHRLLFSTTVMYILHTGCYLPLINIFSKPH